MFTERFIKIPISLYNTKEAEMIGFNEQTRAAETFMCILPLEISHYRPAQGDGDGILNCTSIHMKNGDDFYARILVEDFERLCNDKLK